MLRSDPLPTYRDLFEVHLRYSEYIRAKSYVIHQYVQNIAVSGAGVETEVRAVLRSILPDRFRVTSGYIVSAESKNVEPRVSPQVDILIVDTLVPHSLWVVDRDQGVEIVPREAVVGIIEVKSTLSPASVLSSIRHLRKIVDEVDIRKDDNTGFMPGGMVAGMGLLSPYRGNPIIGVIGLGADTSFAAAPSDEVLNALTAATEGSSRRFVIDFVLSLSGIFVATADSGSPGNYEPKLVQTSPASHWAEASMRSGREGRVGLAQGLGFILAYVGKTCGRVADTEKYFFNDAIR